MADGDVDAQLLRLLAQHLARATGGSSMTQGALFDMVNDLLVTLELNFGKDKERGLFYMGIGNEDDKIAITVNSPPVGVVIYVILPVKVPPQYRVAAARHTCSINYNLSVGNFELSPEGEVRFKVSFSFAGPVIDAAIQSAFLECLRLAVSTFDSRKPSYLAICRGVDLPGPAVSEPPSAGRARSGTNSGSSAGISILAEISRGNSDPDAIRALIRRGGDANEKTASGYTCLMSAASQGYADVCRVLVQDGKADMRARNANNDSALSLAVFKSQEAAALELIRLGHEASIPDRFGDTPLLDACKLGLTRVVSALLFRGGLNLGHRNAEGLTALQLARNKGNDEIARLLTRAGAVA